MSTWFGNWFSKIQIYFPNHRSTWIVEEVLSSQIMNSFEPFEERVVLNCKRVKPSTGEEAIIKAHLQWESHRPPFSLPLILYLYLSRLPLNITLTQWVLRIPDEDGLPAEKLAKQASTSVNTIAETELQFLTHLTEHGCSSTPQLLDTVKVQQPDSMCLPGGYILFILMEKLPGKMIMDYWDYDRETRDRIRAAFKASWS